MPLPKAGDLRLAAERVYDADRFARAPMERGSTDRVFRYLDLSVHLDLEARLPDDTGLACDVGQSQLWPPGHRGLANVWLQQVGLGLDPVQSPKFRPWISAIPNRIARRDGVRLVWRNDVTALAHEEAASRRGSRCYLRSPADPRIPRDRARTVARPKRPAFRELERARAFL